MARLATGTVLLALGLFCLWQGGLFWLVLLGLVGMFALTEMWLLAQSSWRSGEGLLSLVALPLLLLVAAMGFFEIGVSLLAASGLLAAYCAGRSGRPPAWSLLGLPVLSGGLMLVAFLGIGGWNNATGSASVVLLLWLLAVVCSVDSGAYCAGRVVGGPRLAPGISPNKTWSGLVGGLICGGVVGVVAGVAATRHVWDEESSILPLLLLGLGVALVSQLGDLLESVLKRRAGVKDSGSILPGHGGMLDRIDSLIAGVWFVLLLGTAREGWRGGEINGESIARGVLSWL